ncbi:MAG: TetR/AcrR family transcriptional regulator [Gemmatimonadales bacterium]
MTTPLSPPPAPPPQPKRDGEATRQKLLRAALELYTTIGFRGTTTPMIAEKAGVAEGTIYRHFTGKEHLLNEIYRGAQRWGGKLLKEGEGERPARASERLVRFARQLAEASERDPAVVRMLFYPREDQHLDDKSHEARREFREGLYQIVAAGKSDGLIRSGPAELWASVWFALVEFVVYRICTKEWTADHPQVALTLEAAWDAVRERAEG